MKMRLNRKDEVTRQKHRQTKELSCADLVMPLFIKEGDVIKVDTRTREYMERV